MNRIMTFGAALATILSLTAAPARAQIAVLSQGENFAVQRDPADTGNVVGGGAVDVLTQGENVRIRHLDPAYAERPPGIPFEIGGRHGDVVYLPTGAGSALTAELRQPPLS